MVLVAQGPAAADRHQARIAHLGQDHAATVCGFAVPLPRPARMKNVPEIRHHTTIVIAIGSEECVPAMPTSGAAIEAENEKPRPSIAEPVPANSRA